MSNFIKLTDITRISSLTEYEKNLAKRVAEQFAFQSNDYYMSLIDWNDSNDPIRRLIVPDHEELEPWGRLDASNEKSFTVIPGLQHKYNSTCLLLASNQCGGLCRYCFRKRIFLNNGDEMLSDLSAAIGYIREHTEITNVLITGGDPLMLPTDRIEEILAELSQINHVRLIRIGTKMLSFNPFRILNDPSFINMVEKYSAKHRKLYIITHFDHVNELTDPAVEAIHRLQRAGAILTNQTPLIRGINDDPDVLAELFRKVSFVGVPPYYVFQCRPAIGNKPYAVPIEEGYRIVEQAKAKVSGLAKRARYVMSHATGKIEIVGKTQTQVFFKYHRAADDADSGRFMAFNSNPDAYWFDDYQEVIHDYAVAHPYRTYGPE